MIYKRKPKLFNPRFEVVSCFCEYQGKILMLHRQDYKDRGNTWGVPAGKIDNDEVPIEAILRELREETSIQRQSIDLKHLTKVYVRYPDYDFIYHIFHLTLDREENVEINLKEHKSFTWVSPQEALKMELVPDQDICIKMCYKLD